MTTAVHLFSDQLGVPRRLPGDENQAVWFFVVVALALFSVGSVLVFWGDRDRQEQIIFAIRHPDIDNDDKGLVAPDRRYRLR